MPPLGKIVGLPSSEIASPAHAMPEPAAIQHSFGSPTAREEAASR